MTSLHPPALPESDAILCIICILLVPLAGAGLTLINAGLGRSRSAAHLMFSSLCAISVAAIVYLAVGYSWQGFAGLPAHAFNVSGKQWNWLASQPFFFRGLAFDASPASLAACLGLFGVGLAALVPIGSGADRWRLSATWISTAVLAGITYPLFAHWAWGGGWLAELGSTFGLGQGFVDAGGAGTIQVVGGLTALSVAWILGPRRGKYMSDGVPTAIPGHNAVIVLFGCLLAAAGWTGLSAAGALLFTRETGPGAVALAAVNSLLSAAAAGLTAALITHMRFGKPDASLAANGWVGGLVAISASSALDRPLGAIVIGAVAGALVMFSVEWFELRFGVDDPAGAISAHVLGGIWGLLAVALFARVPGAGKDSGQGLAQIIGVATLMGFILPLTYFLNWLIDRFHPQRVPADGEHMGMDLYELGAGAYPEFVTHSDEFTQRKI